MHNFVDKIKNTWTYNHPHTIVTLALLTAVVWQAQIIQPNLPTFSFTSVTSAENTPAIINNKTIPDDCDYQCLTTIWVNMRAAEIVIENEQENYSRARLEALLEANDLLTKI